MAVDPSKTQIPNLDRIESGAGNGKTTYRSVDISFRGICLKLSNRQVLQDVFGEVKSGEILVVMGPTGAGKTSLMNALSGRRPPDKGEILANGKRMTRYQRRMIGYVEQRDLFIPSLTLYDTLKLTALLKLPKTMPYKAKIKRVEQVIEILELKKCRDTVVGNAMIPGLSSGEKKRTNIACELLTNPALLIMDEPTTGLDSNTAYKLIYAIKQFCVKYHKSVMINIHQPSSQIYYMSDKLLLLINGEVGYYGSSKQVLQSFERVGLHCPAHYNPADFIMDCARAGETTVKKLVNSTREVASEFGEIERDEDILVSKAMVEGVDNQAFDASHDDLVITTRKKFDINDEFLLDDVDLYYDPQLKYQSSYQTQLFVLTLRQMKIILRTQAKPLNLIAMSVLLLLIVGLFFDTKLVEDNMRERLAFLYFITVHLMFRCTLASVYYNIESQAIVLKERMSNAYHLSALCLAVFLADMALGSFIQLIISVIGYWTTGFRSFSTFLLFLVLLILFSSSVTAIVACEMTILNDMASAMLAALLTCLFGFLISGYVIKPMPDWGWWLKYLVPMGYVYNPVIQEYLQQDLMIACSNTTSVFAECIKGEISEFESSRLLYDYDWAVPIPGNIIVLVFVSLFSRYVNYLMLRYWRTPLNHIKPSKFTLQALKNRMGLKRSRDHGNGKIVNSGEPSQIQTPKDDSTVVSTKNEFGASDEDEPSVEETKHEDEAIESTEKNVETCNEIAKESIML